jgi:hypothetical protein
VAVFKTDTARLTTTVAALCFGFSGGIAAHGFTQAHTAADKLRSVSKALLKRARWQQLQQVVFA